MDEQNFYPEFSVEDADELDYSSLLAEMQRELGADGAAGFAAEFELAAAPENTGAALLETAAPNFELDWTHVAATLDASLEMPGELAFKMPADSGAEVELPADDFDDGETVLQAPQIQTEAARAIAEPIFEQPSENDFAEMSATLFDAEAQTIEPEFDFDELPAAPLFAAAESNAQIESLVEIAAPSEENAAHESAISEELAAGESAASVTNEFAELETDANAANAFVQSDNTINEFAETENAVNEFAESENAVFEQPQSEPPILLAAPEAIAPNLEAEAESFAADAPIEAAPELFFDLSLDDEPELQFEQISTRAAEFAQTRDAGENVAAQRFDQSQLDELRLQETQTSDAAETEAAERLKHLQFLQETTEVLAAAKPETAAEAEAAKDILAERYIVFALDNANYGFSAENVVEISQPLPVTRLPFVPAWFLGVANLRGDVLPIIGLRELWNKNVADASGARRKLIVVRSERMDAQVGLLVDAVREMRRCSTEEIWQAIEQAEPHLAAFQLGKVALDPNADDNQSLWLLDAEKLLEQLEVGSRK